MRLLICGDRNWTDKDLIKSVLQSLNVKVDCIIEGEARGVDTLAREVAEELKIPVEGYPARWGECGRAAGPIRNQQMLDEGKSDAVLAFHDDIEKSKGTKDMINRARKAGVPVTLISHPTEGACDISQTLYLVPGKKLGPRLKGFFRYGDSD